MELKVKILQEKFTLVNFSCLYPFGKKTFNPSEIRRTRKTKLCCVRSSSSTALGGKGPFRMFDLTRGSLSDELLLLVTGCLSTGSNLLLSAGFP